MERLTTYGVLLIAAALFVAPCARADEADPPDEPGPPPAAESESSPPPASAEAPTETARPRGTPGVAELPPVVVTGTPLEPDDTIHAPGVPEVSLNSVGSRDVFGPRRVRETGARDVNDLVHNLPALSSRPYNGGEAAAPSFSMRGLPDDGLTEYVHVLVDGVSASPLPYGWTAFSFLPITTDRIYAIDYVRGAHSVRYSPNTVGGILNFITEPIPRCPKWDTRATIGSFGYSSIMTSIGGTRGRFGFLATAVDRRGDGYRDDGEFDQQDINLKLRYMLGRKSWIAGSFTFMDSDHKAPGGLTRAQFDVDRFANGRPHNKFDGDRKVGDIVLHLDQGRAGWFEAFAYGSRTWRHLRAQRPHFGAPATISNWTDASYFVGVGARFERTARIGGCCHTFYGGVRYQREWIPHYKIESEPFPGGPGTPTQDTEVETDTFSIHLDDTWNPLPRLTLQAGVRFEAIPNTKGEDPIGGWAFDDEFYRVLPGVGASYRLTHHASVFANYFEGFRAPQVWGYAYTVASGDLQFELGRSAEAGVRWKCWRGFSGSVTGWRTVYDDFGVFYSGFYENLGKIEAKGVDFVVQWEAKQCCPRLCGLSFDASLTLQDSELRSGPNKGNETPYAWETKAAWRARYERAGWHASLGGTYVGESYSDDANTAIENADGNLGINPDVMLWDARIAKTLCLGRCATLEISAGATNLFDEDWHVHSRGGFFGGGLVAGPPRQVYGALQFSIDL